MTAIFVTARCLINWGGSQDCAPPIRHDWNRQGDHLNLVSLVFVFQFQVSKVEGSNVLKSLDGPMLDTEVKNFEEILHRNRKKLFDEHFIDGKKRPDVSHHPLYVTADQSVVAEDISNATKDEILKRIADKLQQVSDEDVRGPLSIKVELIKAQPNKAKKDTLFFYTMKLWRSYGTFKQWRKLASLMMRRKMITNSSLVDSFNASH